MMFVISDEVISSSPEDFTARFRSVRSMIMQVIEKHEHMVSEQIFEFLCSL